MPIEIPEFSSLNILSYPNPVLRQNSELITDITPQIIALSEHMADMMEQSLGIGLAAPQIGLSIRMIVISLSGKAEHAAAFINPVLSNLEGETDGEEGCLSVPGVRANVKRYSTCTVTATNIHGKEFSLDADELLSIALQHETDHLEGKLFIDKISSVSKLVYRRALKKLEADYKNNK